MLRHPPRSTRTYPLFPNTTLIRSLGAQFETDLDARTSAILRIDYSAFGDLYWFVDNMAKQDAVHLVNARLTIEHEPWTLTLSGDNLFNKRYNRSEEHTSELQSLMRNPYADFCWKT